MEKKEAVWILENGAWWDSLPDDMSDADKTPLLAAIDVALDALKMPEKGDPLTIEQLRKMNNTPIWVIPIKSEHDYCGWCVVSVSDRGDKYSCAEIPGVEYWSWSFESYGESWIAYAYPPAHIAWDAWEPCELCISCENCKNSNVGEFCNPCFRCLQSDKKDGFSPVGFCRKCGRPLTEEAQAELEKRLKG